ncbi:MAG: hypothetical protein JWM55_64 [Acidimicrobiaceae bacterium]|nr:hypothetical protein [Acidimicrobiaceae bacterium]
MAPTDLPEAAQRRLSEGAFSSALGVSDFAACLEMGLEPVGLVQGFCAMQQGSYMMGGLSRSLSPYGGSAGGYVQNYQCSHGMISNEHRTWGQNYEQTWVETAWMQGFTSSFSRMLEEAGELGAHGVVGVVDTVTRLTDAKVLEFHMVGTAVKVLDAPAPTTPPWSTYLAGQRLSKLFEAGLVPVSIIASISSIRVWAYCTTEFLMGGAGTMLRNSSGPQEIDQIVSAKSQARFIARSNVRAQLGSDSLRGANLELGEWEFERGDYEFQAVLRGNRVRRFKNFDPLPVPRATVRLS